jgi:hypothetical protein
MARLSKTIWLLIFIATGSMADDSAKEAVELLQKSEALMRSSGTEAEYRIDIVRPEWRRTMTFRSHDDRDNKRFRMEILSPRKTKGTVFLKVNNILSMYLPKLRRQINISPAMMQDPWMGSDFNNQDLLETEAMLEGHSHKLINRQGEGAAAVYTIESIPDPETTVTWKKLVRKIRGDGVPLEMAYHCKQKVKRLMVFDQIAEMGGRIIPTRWTMKPNDGEGKSTVITLQSIKFNLTLDPKLFTPI